MGCDAGDFIRFAEAYKKDGKQLPVGLCSDFGRFVEANYPDDWAKISSPDVEEDVVFTVYSRLEQKYDIWKRIPEWVKNYFGDRLPAEVFSWQEPYDRFELDFEKRILGDNMDARHKLDAFIYRTVDSDERAFRVVSKALDKGYSKENSYKIGYESYKINKTFSDPKFIGKDGKVNKKGRKIIRKCRQNIKKIIKEDWKENQVHRYALRMAKEYDIYTRKSMKTKNVAHKLKYKLMAVKSLYYFNKYHKKVEDEKMKTTLSSLIGVLKINHNRLQTKNMMNEVHRFMDEESTKVAINKFSNKSMDGVPRF